MDSPNEILFSKNTQGSLYLPQGSRAEGRSEERESGKPGQETFPSAVPVFHENTETLVQCQTLRKHANAT